MKRYIIIVLLLILLLPSVVAKVREPVFPPPYHSPVFGGECQSDSDCTTVQCPDGTQVTSTCSELGGVQRGVQLKSCSSFVDFLKCPNIMGPIKCGDLDRDGYLTQNDIKLLKIGIINKNFLESGSIGRLQIGGTACADLNTDHKIDNTDVVQAEAVLNGQVSLRCRASEGFISDADVEYIINNFRYNPMITEAFFEKVIKQEAHPIYSAKERYAQYISNLPTEAELKPLRDFLHESKSYSCSGENPIISGVPQQASVAQCSGTIGDLNGDSSVSMNDALILLSEVVMGRLPSTPTGLCCRDADGNGIVDSDDVTTIFSIARGKIHVPTSCGVALPPSQAGPIQPLTPQPLPRSTCSNPIDFSLALTQHPTLYGSNCNTGGGCFIEHEFRSGAICCGAPNLGSILFYKNTRTQKEWAFAPNRDGKAIIKVFLTNTNIGDNFDVYANCP